MSNIVKVLDFDADLEKHYPISARDLWQGLESKDDFSTWVKDQISRGRLVENIDYLINREKPVNSKRGRPQIEYMFTVKASKNVCLMSNTAKGGQYRQALITLEEKYLAGELTPGVDQMGQAKLAISHMLDIYAMFEVPRHLAQIESIKATKRLTGVDLSYVLKLAPAQDNISEKDLMLEPTECATRFGFKSAIAFNRFLSEQGVQKRNGDNWEPVGEAISKTTKHAWAKGGKSGYNLKWNISFLDTFLMEENK